MTAFEDAFGVKPRVTRTSPGRVNLIGEHTDYNGGMVLPTALPLGVTVELTARPDDKVRIASSIHDGIVEADLETEPSGAWSDYALGAVIAAQREEFLSGGADVAIESNLPEGAGLASSAALIVGVLKAAADTATKNIDPAQAAVMARSVESEFVGIPVGIMDQMAVSIAAPGQALALDSRTLNYDLIGLPTDYRFVVIHSGQKRKLREGRYKRRKEACEMAAQMLGAEYLCLVSDSVLDKARSLPPKLAGRARHVATEHRRTVEAAQILGTGDMARFGELMNESHASMRDDFEMSLPEIDALVETAVKEGAVGARLTGGGFGGCIVALLPTDEADAWIERVLKKHPDASLVC